MGWEYVLVDAGWSASWMPTLVKYAQARHVGVWIWTRQPDIDTQARISAAFSLWKSWGVVGLKIDHIRSEQQVRMKWYDQVLATSAQNKLMVDFHGSTIPRGIERTWPQVLTMEGVQGAEKIRNRPDRNAFPATHYPTLPFTRNLAGSMDYTPVTFTAKRTNTDAAELAQSVVFESGLQNFADSVESYDAHPVAERFLRQVPAAWDETRLVSGNPDTHVVLARRNGTNWFVGAVTAGGGRTIAVPLGFLGAGSWLADVYSDSASGLAVRTQQVTGAGTLSLTVATNGGFTVRLCPLTPMTRSAGLPSGGARPTPVQPLTAPAVRPVATCRWMIRNSTTTGRAEIVAPAMSGPQAVPRRVWLEASQAIRFCFSGLLSVLMMMNSFHAWMNP